MNMRISIDEPILDDDYPVYFNYLYVVDGRVRQSPIEGDVARLKKAFKATEVRRCDISARRKMNKDINV